MGRRIQWPVVASHRVQLVVDRKSHDAKDADGETDTMLVDDSKDVQYATTSDRKMDTMLFIGKTDTMDVDDRKTSGTIGDGKTNTMVVTEKTDTIIVDGKTDTL